MKFEGTDGKLLTIRPTAGMLQRVQSRTGYDLTQCVILTDEGENEILQKLLTHWPTLASVLYAACEPDIDATLDGWLNEFDAKIAAAGRAALFEALPHCFDVPEAQAFCVALLTEMTEQLEAGRNQLREAVASIGSPEPTTAPGSQDTARTSTQSAS